MYELTNEQRKCFGLLPVDSNRTLIDVKAGSYGDFEIIGNIPIGESEDYPIMYGGRIDIRYRAVFL